jgi:phosphoribosylaminoimidazolecarboxamide formyltransferase/IMP cyclohydrolase
MVRAAATNFKDVIVIVDILDYKKVAKAIIEKKVTIKLRMELAIKAYKYTKNYDNAII